MMVNLSVKNVPEEVVQRLREQAKRHHRSLQGELLTILEEAVEPRKLSIQELDRRVNALGRTGDDSTAWMRADRDARPRRPEDFRFIGAGHSDQGALSPISERHDEALAEDLAQ